MDSSRQKRMTKINFNLGLVSTNEMLRFKLDVNFVHCKSSFINIFPSLAILSHVDKTKIFKLTSNIPP